jgi:hypothetical protein
VEDGPVIQVVEVNGSGVDAAVVRDAGEVEDGLAGVITVDVGEDGGVVTVEVVFAEFDAGIGFDPCFTLCVAGAIFFDEIVEVVPGDAEVVSGHFVIATADGVFRVDLAGGVQGGFEPDARQVEDAERAGGAGGDQGNDLTHEVGWVGL